jgi:hypothetical protein
MVRRLVKIVSMAAVVAAVVVVAAVPAFAAVAKEDIVRNLTITQTTIDPQTKVVTVKGRVRCADAVNRAFVEVSVSQVVGRLHTVRGERFKALLCEDGGPTPFTLRFSASEGRFAPGGATLRALTGACIGREFDSRCDFDRLTKEVRLTRS